VDKTRRILLDFEVDKLTNSIENIVTGDSFRTGVILVTKEDIKAVTKKNGWDLTIIFIRWAPFILEDIE
jgi:hypothetical protein